MSAPEVLVVGGGPAGLATAIALRQHGLRVSLLDRRRPPLDKPCGEGLMPGARRSLRELGVGLEESESYPFRQICYVDAESRVSAELPEPGLGMRRLELHRLLSERAVDVGVEVRWGVIASGLEASTDGYVLRTSEGVVAPRWIVAADGLRSRLRRWAGLERCGRAVERFGMRRHYARAPWSDAVEVHWTNGCEAYVTPVGRNEVGVAVLWSGHRGGFDDLLRLFPALERQLAGARRTSSVRGTGPLEQRVRAVRRGNLVLVGDAAGYLDAITGEGLELAFGQARAVAAALAVGEPGRYPAAHRRLGRRAAFMTRLTLLLSRRPRLRRRVLATFESEPELFRRLLAIHAGSAPLRSVGLTGVWRLARCVGGAA